MRKSRDGDDKGFCCRLNMNVEKKYLQIAYVFSLCLSLSVFSHLMSADVRGGYIHLSIHPN